MKRYLNKIYFSSVILIILIIYFIVKDVRWEFRIILLWIIIAFELFKVKQFGNPISKGETILIFSIILSGLIFALLHINLIIWVIFQGLYFLLSSFIANKNHSRSIERKMLIKLGGIILFIMLFSAIVSYSNSKMFRDSQVSLYSDMELSDSMIIMTQGQTFTVNLELCPGNQEERMNYEISVNNSIIKIETLFLKECIFNKINFNDSVFIPGINLIKFSFYLEKTTDKFLTIWVNYLN